MSVATAQLAGALASAKPIAVLVESASKEAPIAFGLRRAGFPPSRILVVGRELLSYKSDASVGVDVALREIGRVPLRQALIERLREECQDAPQVVIATDTSPVGDALAHDIQSTLLGGHRDVKRARMDSLDHQSVADAFRALEPIVPADAWTCATRRVLDRLIRPLIPHPLCISTVAILSSIANDLPPLGQVTLSLNADDGLDPFVATMDVTASNVERAEELLLANLEFNEAGESVRAGASYPVASPYPWTSNQAVLAIAQVTGRTVLDVTATMLRLYETGRLTYPHSSASALTPAAVKWLGQMANHNGLRIDPRKVPLLVETRRHGHESPRPLEIDVDISTPALLLNQEDAILSILTRHLITVAQPWRACEPTPESLPDWALGLGLTRRSSQWMNPWPRKRVRPTWEKTDLSVYALSAFESGGLGRPEAGAVAADRFASLRLLGSNFELTSSSRALIDQLPSALMDPLVHKRLEAVIRDCASNAKEHGPPQQLVKDLIDSMGLWREAEVHLSR